jgi:hypothetical protein
VGKEEVLLRRLRAVGGAGTFALAAILTGVLGIAAALALTVVLALAGVLGESGSRSRRTSLDTELSSLKPPETPKS